MVREVKNIKVLNYMPCFIALTGRNNRSVAMKASDGVNPTVEYFTFEDLEYINSVSPVFRTGAIEFDPEYAEELYEELHIQKENCIFERDIDNMLLHPTATSLERIVEINDVSTMERIRGHMAANYSYMTQEVVRVVNQRTREINAGTRKSKIEIVRKPSPVQNEELEAMANKVAQLEAMINKMTAAPVEEKEEVSTPVETLNVKPVEKTATVVAPKKPGRPKKATTK